MFRETSSVCDPRGLSERISEFELESTGLMGERIPPLTPMSSGYEDLMAQFAGHAFMRSVIEETASLLPPELRREYIQLRAACLSAPPAPEQLQKSSIEVRLAASRGAQKRTQPVEIPPRRASSSQLQSVSSLGGTRRSSRSSVYQNNTELLFRVKLPEHLTRNQEEELRGTITNVIGETVDRELYDTRPIQRISQPVQEEPTIQETTPTLSVAELGEECSRESESLSDSLQDWASNTTQQFGQQSDCSLELILSSLRPSSSFMADIGRSGTTRKHGSRHGPRAEGENILDQRLREELANVRQDQPILALPALDPSGDPLEQSILFIRKCRACTRYIPLQSPGSPDYPLQQKKYAHLQDLASYASSDRVAVFGLTSAYPDIIQFVSGNIFRPQSRPTYEAQGGIYDPEEDEQVPDPAWPLLRPVYEILLKWVVSKNLVVHSATKVFTHTFLGKFVALFDSEDVRERNYCKSVLHRIYGRLATHRAFIRARIYDELVTYIQETQRHNGIADYLELLGPIINGFNVPIKDEHIQMLIHVLVPLHAAPNIIMYYRNLNYCVTQFIGKDTTLSGPVLSGLLRIWPQTSATKVACFLDELISILKIMPPPQFTAELATRVSKLLALSCASPHFQISVRAMRSLEQEAVLQLLLSQRRIVYSNLVPALASTANSHWSDTVGQINSQIIRLFHNSDPSLFDEVYSSLNERRHEELLRRRAVQMNYNKLRQIAFDTAQDDQKLMRILCRVDAYKVPVLPGDIHGLTLLGQSSFDAPALNDESLVDMSMQNQVESTAASQTYLIGFGRVPYDPSKGKPLECRHDSPLRSPLDKPLIALGSDVDDGEVSSFLYEQGYSQKIERHGELLAPTVSCRGYPTLSAYQLSSKIVAEASVTGIIPLSAALDIARLKESRAELIEAGADIVSQSPPPPVQDIAPWSSNLFEEQAKEPFEEIAPAALTEEEAAAVTQKLESTSACRVSTKRSFSVHPDAKPVDPRPLTFDVDLPDSFSDDSSS